MTIYQINIWRILFTNAQNKKTLRIKQDNCNKAMMMQQSNIAESIRSSPC